MLFLFHCGLFNDAISTSDCIASRGTTDKMIGKDVEANDHGLIWCIIPVFTWRDYRKHEKFRENWSPVGNLNWDRVNKRASHFLTYSLL
jgi:hypothetical protein